jgi:hypothetical protein
MRAIEQILKLRDAGHTTCAIVDVPSPSSMDAATQSADQIVRAHGFQGIADGWIEISANDAHAIIATLLHRDLAYGAELMPLSTASELSAQLLDGVPEPHRYFTNGDWTVDEDGSGEATLNGWNPISDATFDSGVVCLGESRAALFWVQDED